MPQTSERHTELLNGFQTGNSRFVQWAREHFGDIRLASWEYGRISMVWEIDDRFLMQDGVMFGGHVSSVADLVTSLVAMTALEDPKDRFRTSRLETNFFRPVMKPRLRIEGRVVNASKSLIHVEADFFNAEDKLAARIDAVQARRVAA